jgi:hypothetical protein
MPASGQFDRLSASSYALSRSASPCWQAVLFHVLLIRRCALDSHCSTDLFPHNSWGGANDGSAIAVQLVSSALPCPQDHKPNDNVLATETPSEAPAPPAPKAQGHGRHNRRFRFHPRFKPPKKVARQKTGGQQAGKTGHSAANGTPRPRRTRSPIPSWTIALSSVSRHPTCRWRAPQPDHQLQPTARLPSRPAQGASTTLSTLRPFNAK